MRGWHRGSRQRPGPGGHPDARQDAAVPAAHLGVLRRDDRTGAALPRLAAAIPGGGLRGRRARHRHRYHQGPCQRQRLRRPAAAGHRVLRRGLHHRDRHGGAGDPVQASRHAVPRCAFRRAIDPRAGAADRGRNEDTLADRAVRRRGDPGQPAPGRPDHHAARLHELRAAVRYHPAYVPPPVGAGHGAGLLLAHGRHSLLGHRLRLPRRAGQCHHHLAGVRPALRGDHLVRPSVRPAVAAVVDQPGAAGAGQRPARSSM